MFSIQETIPSAVLSSGSRNSDVYFFLCAIYHELENPKVKFNQVTQKTGVEQREVDNSMVILTISESNLLSCKLLQTGETVTSGKQKFRHQKSYNQTPLFLFVPKKLTFLSIVVVVLFLFFTPQFTLNIKTKRSTTMPLIRTQITG